MNSLIPLKDFQVYLNRIDLSSNTIRSYVGTMRLFLDRYDKINFKNIALFKSYLIGNYKTQTVNLRLQGLNKYLEFIGKGQMKVKLVKIQQKNFLENIISNEDYIFMKESLKSEGKLKWYFIIWIMGATGVRVSELLQIKAEHIAQGYIDLYSKGGKTRRIYFPTVLIEEIEQWLREKNLFSGPIFLNRSGNLLTTTGIALVLKYHAEKYGIRKESVYPHSFRHLFAKNFLERFNDLALLADLMGHKNIETTRIYLRRTANEQRELIDKVINW